jgi:hypothetical protein
MRNKIDFIITWVDDSDLKWRKTKEFYCSEANLEMNSDSRYRNWDFLKFWFRSVEQHAPWVNKVFFVTEGHLPKWLNTNYEKLVIVRHDEFISSDFLPTFNSNVIELSFGEINGLSDHFVSFNDDMFLNRNVTEQDFFLNNLPRDCGVFSPVLPIKNTIDGIVLNNVEIINEYFDKNKVLKRYFFKYFNFKYKKQLIKNLVTLPWNSFLGFYDNHIPISYRKDIFNEVIALESDKILQTKKNKFRTREDISHWLIRYWQLCTGNFSPRSTNFGAYYNITDNPVDILSDIKESKHKVICLNDNERLIEFEKTKKLITEEFSVKYNVKSKFEK